MSTPPKDFDWLADLCRKEEAAILPFCRRLLYDEQDALDAWQETQTRAVLHWEKVLACESQQRGPWLTEVARNVCQETLRRRARDTTTRRPLQPPDRLAPIGQIGAARWRQAESEATVVPKGEAFWRYQAQRMEDARDSAEKFQHLAELAQGLPLSLQIVAQLALDGHKPAEIADRLGLTLTAVNLRLHRARKEMVALLAQGRD